MKKLLSLIICCSLVSSVICQGEEDQRKTQKKCELFATLTLALNHSSINGDSESYSGSLFGGYFGIGTDLFCITPKFSVHGELAYSQQGSEYESYQYEPGGGSLTEAAKVRLNYLVLPITARVKSSKGLHAEAGFQPGLLLSAKDKHDGQSDDIKDDYNGFDLGLVLGAGYRSPKSKLGVGIRVVPGLSNINKSEGTYSVKDKNFNASLRLSYNL